MNLRDVRLVEHGILLILADDGRTGRFDVRPYFGSLAFRPLSQHEEFRKVRNGRYYIAWECGADLSADTIEARWVVGDGLPGLADGGRPGH